MESRGDAWLAPDKLYHLFFCLSLTIFFSLLANRFSYPFIRRRSMSIASFLSLFVGAAKEAADQCGFFHSAGASAKDAIADIVGVLIACLALSLYKLCCRRTKLDLDERDRGVALV